MFHRMRAIWRILGTSIYNDEHRRKRNLKTMAAIAMIMEIPAFSGTMAYFFTPLRPFAIGCLIYAAFNVVIFYLAAVKKDRESAARVLVILALVACTNIALFASNGFAAHWTLIFPLVVCYLCGVRLGIISSLYMTLLFMALYWTPLRVFMEGRYPDVFLDRFPLFYMMMCMNTAYIMIEYHVNILYQQQYERRLEAARDEASAANQAKSEFLASMSHEIRTPLNAVLGMDTIILRDCQQAIDLIFDNPELVKILEDITSSAGDIENAGNNLLLLINQILDFSKIEAGKVESVEANYKLSSILNDISNMIAIRAKSKGLEFSVDVNENLPDDYFGDEMRMRLIMQNILTNAVKYTDTGSVSFAVSSANFSVVHPGGTLLLKIVVKDTGIGIKDEDITKIFRRFERVNLEHNSTIEGTGLGLAIVHLLCSKMGGTVDLKSEYGKGSVFTLTIPQKVISCEPVGNFREKFERSILNREHYHELFKAPDARILIVDDTHFNLVVAAGLLKKTDIMIDTAISGAEAVSLAGKSAYDLILMDQRMPEMDGTEALHRIREFDKNTPVICLTADAILGARAKYLAEGFTDYLTKPIDGNALEKMLKKYLPKDKIITVNDSDSEGLTAEEHPDDFTSLRKKGIQVDTGLRYAQNDEELYRSLLGEYAASSEERREAIRRFCDSEDCEQYGIVVHALKSASRMIGAVDFSELCALLEKASDDGDIDTITNRTTEMLKLYDEIVGVIRSAGIASTARQDDDEVMEFFPDA